MKRANEEDQTEVNHEEIKQEQSSINQNSGNPDRKLVIDIQNEEVRAVGALNPPKRRRKNEEDIEMRLLISTKMAGAIIGKSGQNIQKLRTNHDAKINVVDCKGSERVLTIISSLDICYKVIRDVIRLCELSQEFDLRLLIHQSLAGCVIGKGGSKIKELKNMFGCHVKVFPNVAPQSFERVVQIVGNEDKCINCLIEIMNQIMSNNIRGPVRPYDPHNYADFYADEYGGFGNKVNGNMRPSAPSFGNPFGNDRVQRSNNNNNNGNQNNFNNNNNNNINNNNNRGKFNNERRVVENRRMVKTENNYAHPWALNTYSNNNQMTPMNNFGQHNMGDDFISFNNFLGKSEETSTQVTIPINLAGACIGKGGSRIRSIRNESQAFIKIDQPLPGSTDRIITITGTPKQIQSAQFLLQRSVQNGMN